MKQKKMSEMMLNNQQNQHFSDFYLQTVNPWAISEKLLKDNPDMPLKVAKAIAFSRIADEYSRLVIIEEHKEQEKNTDLLINNEEIK